MSSNSYVGVAPLTMARTTAGGYINILAGDLVPESVREDDLKRLVDEGFLAEAVPVEAVLIGDTDGAAKPETADEVLARVGDDKVKAQAALDEENAKEKPRKGLVADLEKLLAA